MNSLAILDEQLVLEPSIRGRLEKFAEAAGQGASEIASAVLRQFLDEHEREMAAIQAGVEEAKAGNLLAYDDVKARALLKLSALATR